MDSLSLYLKQVTKAALGHKGTKNNCVLCSQTSPGKSPEAATHSLLTYYGLQAKTSACNWVRPTWATWGQSVSKHKPSPASVHCKCNLTMGMKNWVSISQLTTTAKSIFLGLGRGFKRKVLSKVAWGRHGSLPIIPVLRRWRSQNKQASSTTQTDELWNQWDPASMKKVKENKKDTHWLPLAPHTHTYTHVCSHICTHVQTHTHAHVYMHTENIISDFL